MPDIADPRYQELRQIARRLLANSRRVGDPEPTELVHECFLRLARRDGWLQLSETERRAYAARSMRNTLIDLRRAALAAKRGGYLSRLTLDEHEVAADDARALDLLDLSQALEDLADDFPRHAHVVELRYFGGLEMQAIADHLGTNRRAVTNDWAFARAWLHRRLTGSPRPDAAPPNGSGPTPGEAPPGPSDPLAPID